MPTYFDKLPEDVIFYIYAINAVETIIKYYKISLKNKIKNLNFIVASVYFRHIQGIGDGNFEVFYNNRILNNKIMLQIMNLCQCCKRHKLNKPHELSKWVDINFNLTGGYRGRICKCPCRHSARLICRNID